MEPISKEAWDNLEDQYALSQEICSNSNINIVSCGNCGDVFLHRVSKEELTCPYCFFHSEVCDFPDLFHQPTVK
jgi:hypothetical protein